MLLIIALAIYDSIDLAVMAFLLALVVWCGSFFATGYADVDDIIGI